MMWSQKGVDMKLRKDGTQKAGPWHGVPVAATAACLCAGLLTQAGAPAASGSEVERKAVEAQPLDWSELPDWTGVWSQVANTIFDQASVTPPGGAAGRPGVRLNPPLTEEWEAWYQERNRLVSEGLLADPITNCGIPVGFPRVLNLPDVYEFVATPTQTWVIGENGPNVLRIHTDGRGHPPEDDLWPTYTGHSVGYWEGDTLVFETISVKKDGDTITDRTGFDFSPEMSAVTRIRMVDEDRLEARMVFDDPVALTEPWEVVIEYRRMPEGTRVFDYACAENQRNIVIDGRTLTIGPDGSILEDL
jgi:hypothetical protein